MRIVFVLSLLLIFTKRSSAQANGTDPDLDLVQIQVVARHGSRFPLIRDSTTLQEDESTGGITFLGQFQMYDVGDYIRATYNGEGFFNEFRSGAVRVESSATERTIVSADSLSLGLWDEAARDPDGESDLPYIPANIPVYTRALRNDVYLRPFDKCPAYQKDMDQLHRSQEWRDLENSYATLLTKIATSDVFTAITVNGKIPLKEAWTAFDAINVARVECAEATTDCTEVFAGQELVALLDDQEFADLERLIQQSEQLRYSLPNSAKMIGGNLMHLITERLDVGEGSFYVYSTHYPVFYGLFASLGYSPDQATIPSYAASIVFELLEDPDQNYFVTVRYLSDAEDADFIIIYPDGCPTDGPCPWETFRLLGDAYSVVDWCGACQNSVADVCMAASNCSSKLDKPVLAGFLIGFGSWFLLFGLAFGIMRFRKRRAASSSDAAAPTGEGMPPPKQSDMWADFGSSFN